MSWRIVTSDKPRRQGEVFLLNGGTFVLKIYKDSVPDPLSLGRYLVRQFNKLEEKPETKQKLCIHEWEIEGDLESRVDGHLYHQCRKCGAQKP